MLTVLAGHEQLDLIKEVLADMSAADEWLVLFSPEPADEPIHRYFERWAAELDEAFDALHANGARQARWAKAWTLSSATTPGRPSFARAEGPTDAFLAWVDGVAARLEAVAIPVVLVAVVDESTRIEIRDALRRCASAIGATRARLVVLEAGPRSLFADESLFRSLERAADQPAVSPRKRMRRLLEAADLASFCGKHHEAMELVKKARSLANTEGDLVVTALHSGRVLFHAGEVDLAVFAYERGMELGLEAAEEVRPGVSAELIVGMADCGAAKDQLAEADGLYDLAAYLYRQAGNEVGTASINFRRSDVLRRTRRLRAAKATVRAALELALGARLGR
ncbi:MAG: hypothetical protein HOW73_32175 [Polyangiaceae bacterium]|nr:hypothetical protein [Polyangiaceae bacterium]